MSIVVAVDGTAASGKGTLAKRLARHFNFAHLDSGSLYRLTAQNVLRAGRDPSDEAAALDGARTVDPVWANDAAIRSVEVGRAASVVSAFPSVRAALLDYQRDFARRPPGGAPGTVIDGRDIGTVVFPEATAKLFVDAAPAVRAHRRWLELKSQWAEGPGLSKLPDEAVILAELVARDDRDRNRPISPMMPAPDADLLDTTALAIEHAFAAALALVSPKVTSALKARHRG
ncbi:MAG: (d)CMP kinase [Rhizomicrobium sp.]